MDASWKPLKLLSGRFRKKNRASRVEVAASSFPWKTTTTNPTIPTHKKTGENRQTKKRVGAHKKKRQKKKGKKKKGKGKKKRKEPSIISLFSVAKKKKRKKRGKKDVSDVVSSLAWKCHEFVAQDIRFFFGCFLPRLFPSVFVVFEYYVVSITSALFLTITIRFCARSSSATLSLSPKSTVVIIARCVGCLPSALLRVVVVL